MKLRDDKFFRLLMIMDIGIFVLLGILAVLTTSNSDYVVPAAITLALSAVMVCFSIIVTVLFVVQTKLHMMLHGLYVWTRTIAYLVEAGITAWVLVLILMDDKNASSDFNIYNKVGFSVLATGLVGFFALNINWSFTLRKILRDAQDTERELVESSDDGEQKEESQKGSHASKDESSAVRGNKPGQKTQYVSQEIEIADV